MLRYLGLRLFFVCMVVVFVSGQSYYRPDSDEPKDKTGESVELSGANICSRDVYVTEYVYRNVSYSCWETVEVECTGDCERDWYGRRSRRSRSKRDEDGNRRCYKNVLGICWGVYVECVGRWDTINMCCTGYRNNGNGQCVEIIKCDQNNGGCSQNCEVSTDGSHKCTCDAGYQLGEDAKTCRDVDECTKSGSCENGVCHNLDGSYFCSCQNGYRLVEPHKCIEIDECARGNGGCEHDCTNTDGAFYCTCEEGFMLMEGFMCKDSDECALHNGGCSETCVNEVGLYHCECQDNRTLQDDGRTCVDTSPIGPGTGGSSGFTPGPTVKPTAGQLVDDNDMDNAVGMGHNNNVPYGPIFGGLIGLAALVGLLVMAIILAKRFRNRPNGAGAVENNLYGVGGHPSEPPPAYDNPAFITPVVMDKKKGIPSDGVEYDNLANVPKQSQYDNSPKQDHYDNPTPGENVYEQPMDRPVNGEGMENPGYDIPHATAPQSESVPHDPVYQDPMETGSEAPGVAALVNHYEDVTELKANFGKEVV